MVVQPKNDALPSNRVIHDRDILARDLFKEKETSNSKAVDKLSSRISRNSLEPTPRGVLWKRGLRLFTRVYDKDTQPLIRVCLQTFGDSP